MIRARDFVEERGLATVPGGFSWRAALGYPGAALDPGWLQAPGPYDDPATPAVLYLAAEAARRPGVMELLAVAEGFPGRLLQALHAARARGEARRRFPSAGFREGWALYATDLMLEAGYARESGAWHEARRRALVADCRMLAVVALHTGGMTLDEAGGLFVAHGRARWQTRLTGRHCAAPPIRGCGRRPGAGRLPASASPVRGASRRGAGRPVPRPAALGVGLAPRAAG